MKNLLKFSAPSPAWEKGIPLGNGRIGGMLLGETEHEHIWLNEDTLWSGYPRNYNDPETFEYLEKVRKLIFRKEYAEADEIINKHMVGIWNETYLPMADLYVDMEELKEPDSYMSTLDISRGISSTVICKKGVQYERTVFCSYPDQVLVISVQAYGGAVKDLYLRLSSQLCHELKYSEREIVLDGVCPSEVDPDYYPSENPVRYEVNRDTIRFRVKLQVLTDGDVEKTKNGLKINNTEHAVILLTSGNSFIDYKTNPCGEYKKKVDKILEKAAKYTFKELKARHEADFAELFDRVELDLGHSENEELPMDERQQRLWNGEEDPEFIATAFQFGRYLMISGSREGTQPLNLQGIWNNALRAPWSSNYTLNINTEMNYWPAEVCNLSECAEPLIRFIEEVSHTGADTARINYHCRGWAAHHNVDLWRKTTAVGARNKEVNVLPWSFWLMSGGWLCRHLWDHYTFTLDKKYLKRTAYPIMRGAAEFYLDWLSEYNGEYVTVPSTSPENLFIDKGEAHGVTYACTMDNTILADLFDECLKAMEILKEQDRMFANKLREALEKLPPYKIGKYGQLQEWYEDFEENDREHRHLSHIYSLYPSESITVEDKPKLSEACKKAIERRGPGGVPWSRAWKVGIFSRLKDGESAYKEIRKFLQPADSNEISYTEGGVYYNLFCASPLEVDGNFGFTAGVAEMLVQSHRTEVQFLPAIPHAWKDGYVRGLCIRGGREVEIEWKEGKIIKSVVKERQFA